MSFRKQVPNPRAVFDDPNAHFDFLTLASDVDFEGQHFDRKEACRARSDGNVAPSDLRKMNEQITECVSAFSNKNRDGGLLVLGIGSTVEVTGTSHLNETQLNDMIRLDTKLVHHRCESKLVEVTNAQGQPDHIALFYARYVDNAICEEVGANPRAWTRLGRQNVLLNDVDREQIRREKRIVDFERTACCAYIPADLDQGVVKAFAQTFLEVASYHWTDADLLYQAGAIVREDGRSEQFTHAGLLFFTGNPQRVLPHAHIRLLRFDVPTASAARGRCRHMSRNSPGP